MELRSANETEFVICDQAIDVNYIRLQGRWMYLVAVLDWFSRYVVSWELDQTLAQFVMTAVERVLKQATPMIWNSDQGSHFTSPQYTSVLRAAGVQISRGSHFTSPQYTSVLRAAGVQISMDGKGRTLDTIFTERLWRTVKWEEVYLQDYTTPQEARTGLTRYLQFYNHERLHQALGY